MGAKKDPAKFTIRFNLADPQQMMAAGLLERQGRCKAQFITNAILHYINCLQTTELHTVSTVDNTKIECIVRDILAQQQSAPQSKPVAEAGEMSAAYGEVSSSVDTDRTAIFKTLGAFRTD